jgi:hypothetical protein
MGRSFFDFEPDTLRTLRGQLHLLPDECAATAAVQGGIVGRTPVGAAGPSLPIGTTSLTAAYGGDANYAASTSSASSLDVGFTTSLPITGSDSDSSSDSLALKLQ